MEHRVGALLAAPLQRIFCLTYTGVPKGVCLPLVNAMAIEFPGIVIDGSSVLTDTGFSPEWAARACNISATGSFIMFYSN